MTNGKILPDTLFSLRQQRGENWYAVVTAKWDPAYAPHVAVAGPYETEDEAREFVGKRLEIVIRTGKLELLDIDTVPSDVRREITADILRGWESGQFERLRSWKGGEHVRIPLKPRH